MSFLGIDGGKVALFGDWHGNWGWADGAIFRAAHLGAQAAVHLGDFGVWAGAGGDRFLDEVEKVCDEAGITLGFVDGNHENFDMLNGSRWPVRDDGLQELRPHVLHIPRGHRWEWDGVTWMGLGGAVSLDRPHRREGVSWWPGEELTDEDEKRAIDGGPVGVIVAHDAPISVDIPGLPSRGMWPPAEMERTDLHRERIQRVVDATQPRHYFHGHFHTRYSMLQGGCRYTGLDCDGTRFPDNRLLVNTETLKENA